MAPEADGFGAQRKGVEVQEQLSVFFYSSVGNVGVAEDDASVYILIE